MVDERVVPRPEAERPAARDLPIVHRLLVRRWRETGLRGEVHPAPDLRLLRVARACGADQYHGDRSAGEECKDGEWELPHLVPPPVLSGPGSPNLDRRDARGQADGAVRRSPAAASTSAVVSFAASDRPMPLAESERQVENARAWRSAPSTSCRRRPRTCRPASRTSAPSSR